jgi:peptidoglycan hydrolase-like protein with peptidoglycan-binding domain
VSCPFIEDPATIDPKAPADRKVGLLSKAVAAVTPAKAPATKVVVAANVKFGATNEDIKVVQSALVDLLGAKCKVDGKYDAATKAAYKAWQEQLGFKGKDADGNAGAKSLASLGKKYGFSVK